MTSPRGLSDFERALWEQVARSVTPLRPERQAPRSVVRDHLAPPPSLPAHDVPGVQPKKVKGRVPAARPQTPVEPRPPAPVAAGLDSHWERRLRNASASPDVTLDLHGHTLDQAHRRLEQGLSQAKAIDARLVLVVTGRLRPVEAADRSDRRGAIRAKILDWLAAGPHTSDIAAIRHAHRRHGGEGALYIVLKRKGPRNGAPR